MDDLRSRMYRTLADGTVKLWSPLTYEEAWVIPERIHRPRPHRRSESPEPLEVRDPEDHCDFCPARYTRTTPEKARVVRKGNGYAIREHVPAGRLFDERALFRRIANLFEIVTLDFWAKNHGHRVGEDEVRWREAYLDDPDGMEHLRSLVEYKLRCLGCADPEISTLDRKRIREIATPFFGGSHELILAERHYVPDASTTADLASSGSLPPEDHAEYVRFTLAAARDIRRRNPHVRHVAVFQNWLAASGASFDHLHKQLIGLDEWGGGITRKIAVERREPGAFQRYGPGFAMERGLLVAANEGAVAWADVGHRFPTVTVASRGPAVEPAELPASLLIDFADLLHACHAALGSAVPCNEEWHQAPDGAPAPLPLHVHLKWRIHRSAGFEGATRIHIVPLLPEEVRDRTVSRLKELRDADRIRNLRIGPEIEKGDERLGYRTKG